MPITHAADQSTQQHPIGEGHLRRFCGHERALSSRTERLDKTQLREKRHLAAAARISVGGAN